MKQFHLIGALVAALALPAMAQSNPKTVPPVEVNVEQVALEASHLRAITALLQAGRIDDMFIATVRREKPTSPGEEEFYAYILTRLSSDVVLAQLAPVYARYVTEKEAGTLSGALLRPANQRALGAQVDAMALSGKAAEQRNAANSAAFATFYRSAEGKRFVELTRLTKTEVNKAMGQWMRGVVEEIMTGPLKVIAARQVSWVEKGMKEEPEQYVPAVTGLGSVDRFSTVLASAVYRNQHASWQLQRDLAPLADAQVLKPENLAQPKTVVRSLAMLDVLDARLESFLSESSANMTQFVAELRAIPMFAQDSGRFTSVLERQMGISVKFAENQRTMVSLMRQVLTFVQQRPGKISAKGSLLMFDNQADVAPYNALVAELKRQMALEESMTSDTQERARRAAEGKF